MAVPTAFRELNPSKTSQRNVALLPRDAGQSRRGDARRIALRFLLSPYADPRRPARGGASSWVRNRLERAEDGSLRARPTDARAIVSAGLVLRAVGYRGRPLPGVAFDERRGVIDNVGGRVINPDGTHTREYVVGWAKRGPSGVIGTNKRCAQDTVRVLIQDMVAGRLDAPVEGEPAVREWLREIQPAPVTYADWETLIVTSRSSGSGSTAPASS